MSDDDMIRRGDAIAALTEVAVRFGITGEPQIMILAKEALRAIPAEQAGVKPLEWLEHEGHSGFEVWTAFGILGRYKAQRNCEKGYAILVLQNGTIAQYPSIEAAKAAAQADYEARIGSALTAQLGKEVMPDDQGNTHSRLDTSPNVTAGAVPSPDVAALTGLLAEARTNLAAYVDEKWTKHQRSFSSVARERWNRDMEVCRQIDAYLARLKGGAA